MSFKHLKEALASGKIEIETAARLVVPQDPRYAVRGMGAGEITGLDLGLRLAFLQAALAGTQYDDWAVITDDSYWEQEVNYQLLADCGVDAFLIRAYGPSSWVDGAFKPKPDPTWFAKFRAARATKKPVGGYAVHNEWEMVDDPDSSTLAQIQIQQWKEVWYGEFLPDFLCLDWEIPYCFRGNNQIFMPGGNQVKTVRWTLDSMVKEWRKPTWLYSRVTYFNEWGGDQCKSMLDNFNAGGTRAHLHLAYYLNSVLKLPSITTPADFKAILPAYSGTVRTYLEYGSTDVSTRIWQLGPVKHPACPEGAVDWNIIPLTPTQFNSLVGFAPPTDGGGGDQGSGEFEKRLAAVEEEVADLQAWKARIREATETD